MSSRVFGAMMIATLLFSIPVLLCGIWHSNAAASDKKVMGIALLILLLSFVGFIGWSCSLDKPIVIVSDDVLRSLNDGYFIYQRQTTWIMSPRVVSMEAKGRRKKTVPDAMKPMEHHHPMKPMNETTRIKTTMPIICLSDGAAFDCHIPHSNTGIENNNVSVIIAPNMHPAAHRPFALGRK
nr:hypothetical protein Iba_chr13aCG13440 [Ipomoea batatas]